MSNARTALCMSVLVGFFFSACGPQTSDNDLYITEGGKPATRVCPALEIGFLSKEGKRLGLQNMAASDRAFNVDLSKRQPLKVRLYEREVGGSVVEIWGVYASCTPAASQPSWDSGLSPLQNQVAVYDWQKAHPTLRGQTILDQPLSFERSTAITVDIVMDEIFDPTMVMGGDTDHDGVPDSVDQCPTIPRGMTSDPKKLGCPLPAATPPQVATECTGIGVPAAGYSQFVCWFAGGAVVATSTDLTVVKGVWYDTSANALPIAVRLNTAMAISTDASTYDQSGNRLAGIPNMLSGSWYTLSADIKALKSNFPGIGFRLLKYVPQMSAMEQNCPESTISGVSGTDSCQP